MLQLALGLSGAVRVTRPLRARRRPCRWLRRSTRMARNRVIESAMRLVGARAILHVMRSSRRSRWQDQRTGPDAGAKGSERVVTAIEVEGVVA